MRRAPLRITALVITSLVIAGGDGAALVRAGTGADIAGARNGVAADDVEEQDASLEDEDLEDGDDDEGFERPGRRRKPVTYAMPGAWWKDPEAMEKLGITPAQSAHLEALFIATRQRLRETTAEKRKLQRRLTRQISQVNIDGAKLQATLEAYEKAAGEAAVAQYERRLEMRRALTPEQVTRMLDLDPQAMRRSWRGGRRPPRMQPQAAGKNTPRRRQGEETDARSP